MTSGLSGADSGLSPHLRRSLGNTGIDVSPLGFGASPLGGVFGDVDEADGIRSVHEAVKLGVNFFDVSPYYGATKAETVLGKALKELPRDSFVVGSKVGRYGESTFDFSAARVTASVEESLARLNVDRLDLVQCHDIEFGDLDQVVNETLPALVKLREAGKVRAVGVTGYPLDIFPYVLDRVPPGTLDVVLSYCRYTLADDALAGMLPALKAAGVGVINAAPLSMGLLTDAGPPPWHPASAAVKEASAAAAALCKERGSSLAALALQYALNADPLSVTSTVVGIDSTATLAKNVAVMMTPMDKTLLRDVKAIFKPVANVAWASGKFPGA